MTDQHIDKIIDRVFDLGKVFLGAVISWISSALIARKKTNREFHKAIAAILSAQNVRVYGNQLRGLKRLFDEHPSVLEKHPVNCNFYDDWLSHEQLLFQHGEAVWDKEQVLKLQKAVRKLKF